MIRVLLVDDQELVRSGFRIILESEPDVEVVGEAASGPAAVELAASLAPDVICMDVEMPGAFDGIEASRRILVARAETAAAASRAATAAEDRGTAILILTTFGHETYLFDALAAGVSGFLLKTSRAEQLIDAVRTLADGKALLGPDVTRAVIERISADRAEAGIPAGAEPGRPAGRAPAGAPHGGSGPVTGPGSESGSGSAAGSTAALEAAGLTEREREVLRLLAEGRSNAEIAGELFLGEATVKTHVSNVLQKLGVRDRIQAVVWVHTHA